ncbi:hypothetical protein DRQ36_05425 [bacterium]|nr:MAG: hypothetical protein DRQ36_05425 [bacterium]
MRLYRILILLLPIIVFAQAPGDSSGCSGCDLSLSGFAVGGFFGIGTFSVDSDSPQVAEQMGINTMPQWSYRAGGGVYFYPVGKIRLGLIGGYNLASVTDNDCHIKTNAMWGVFMPEIVRTTGFIRLAAGLGFGGGLTSVEVKEASHVADDDTYMFALFPRASFEVPFGEHVVASFDLSYLWLIGEDKTLTWDSPEESVTRELRFTPVEFGGPAFTMSLYFGRIREIVPQGGSAE